MISAGRLDCLLQFRKRGPMSAQAGNTLRPFVNVGEQTFGRYTSAATPFRMYIGDVRIYLPTATLSVRDYDFTRTVSAGYRVLIDGDEFQVRAVNQPYRGEITMDVMQAAWRSRYADDMDQHGTVFEIRRGAGPGFNVRGRAFGFQPQELVNGIDQGDRRILLLAEDVDAAGLVGGIRPNDSVFIRGTKLTVQSVDDSTHRIAEDLCAYQIVAEG